MTSAPTASLISPAQALEIIDSLIQQSTAQEVVISLSASDSALSRFSENQISQNVGANRFKLTVTSYFGKRSASSSTTELAPDALTQTLRRAENLARFAPEDPEWVPLLSPQIYEARVPAFDLATVNSSPLDRGEIVKQVCQLSHKSGVNGSGTLSSSASLQAVGNSLGLRACTQGTQADFSFTARIDNGSSWCNHTAWATSQLPILEATEQVIERAMQSRNPREIQPGVYPVVLSAGAFAALLPWVIWNMDARAADEGRSFMSYHNSTGQLQGNRVGEAMFSPLVQVQRNPAHILLQSSTFFEDGLGNNYLEIIKDGIPQTLAYSRYWAQQQNTQPTGSIYPIVMSGSQQSVADLIAQTERGIFVTRAWYVRYVNPRTLEVTGMTRDGTFWIEDGKIAYPIKNLRFNQQLPQMLRDVEAVSQLQRVQSVVVPAVKIKEFNFSSITDSI